ncbi:MAG: fused MFS/spermidine synthase [Elusimicrobia bacterium]|nr:fused MFS/spermidine synthase [Elusimicrobiota bacterium]
MTLLLSSTFLAGAAALVYEVLWVRLVTISLGHTAPAVASVLTAFMGGLAAGGWLGGRAADRRSAAGALRLYAVLELCAGAAALASRPLLAAAGAWAVSVGAAGLEPKSQAACAFAIAVAILFVPSALLGASLPLLVRAAKADGKPDAPLGRIYGFNTLGAVAGCLAGGLWLLPALGLKAALAWAAGADALAAALAWRAARGCDGSAPLPSPARGTIPPGPAALLLATGAAAMACETAWTRALALLVGSTTYAFSAVLSVILVGLALGSLAYGRWRDEGSSGLARLLLLLSLLVVAGLAAYDRLPWLLVTATGGRHPVLSAFAFSALLAGPPALLMGALLPWSVALAAPARERIGRAVGALYAANTAGAIFGSAAAGLVLLPALGWRGTLCCAALAYAAAAAAQLRGRSRALALAPAALALLCLRGNPRLEASGMFLYAPYYASGSGFAEFTEDLSRDKVIFHETGRNATATVLESPHGERFLRVNGKTDASEGGDMATQLLLGYLPRLWGPEAPRSALVVGLGAGLTAAALADDAGLERLDVVEIEPAVARAARLFSRSNRAVLDDPRLRLVLADARQLLAAPGPRYDLIVSEPSNPWIAGVAYLFTREAFALSRDRLAPGGVATQWFHSYHMRVEDFQLVVRTFVSVFPHAVLLSNGEADYFLLGSQEPLAPDFRRFEAVFGDGERAGRDLSRMARGLDTPFTLLTGTFVLGDADLRRWAGAGPLHEDDRPTLETDAPLSFHRASAGAALASLNAAKTSWLPPGTKNILVRNRDLAQLFAKAAEAALDVEKAPSAAEPISRAMKLDPRSSRAWTAYGRFLDATGRDDEAEAALRNGVLFGPASPDAHARLGIFLYAAGDPARGWPELEAARRLMPGHPLACLGLGWMALESGDKAGARAVLSEALAQPVPEVRLRADLANALRIASD